MNRLLGPLTSGAIIFAALIPVLGFLLHSIDRLDLAIPGESSDARAFVIWKEQVTNPDGDAVVAQVNLSRDEALLVTDALGSRVNRWGLVDSRTEIARGDHGLRTIDLVEMASDVAALFGLPECSEGSLYDLAGQEAGVAISVESDNRSYTVRSARPLPALTALSDRLGARFLTCPASLTTGRYIVAEVGGGGERGNLDSVLSARSSDLLSSLSEQFRSRPLMELLEEQLDVRASWYWSVVIGSVLLALGILWSLTALAALRARGADAVRLVLGATPLRIAKRHVSRALASIGAGLAGGFALSHLIYGDLEGVFSRITFFAVGFLIAAAVIAASISFRQAARISSQPDRLAESLQGRWSTSGQFVLAAFWGLLAAAFVVVLTIQVSVFQRINEFSAFDWGFDADVLTTIEIAVPPERLEGSAFVSRLTRSIAVARSHPGIESATAISPAPWRFRGLARVSGQYINMIEAGPDVLSTLGYDYTGQDFSESSLQAGRVLISQNISDESHRNLLPIGEKVGEVSGYRWDPLSSALPAVLIRPFTSDAAPARFEFVLRHRPGSASMFNQQRLLEQLRVEFPEAVLESPERVSDVVRQRFSDLVDISVLNGIVVIGTLFSMLLLQTVILRQWISQEKRALAIRVALGASTWRATSRWTLRLGVATAIGLAVGAVFAGFVSRYLSAVNANYETAVGSSIFGTMVFVILFAIFGVLVAKRMLSRLELTSVLNSE